MARIHIIKEQPVEGNDYVLFDMFYQQSLQQWIILYKIDGTVWYDTHCHENNTLFLLGNKSHSLLSILIAQQDINQSLDDRNICF